MRINKWSPKRKYLDLLLNSLNWFLKEMYGDQFGEFVCWYWDLKGYRVHSFRWIWIKICDPILMVMINQRNQSRTLRYLWCLNPLSPNSDQHQFSPNNIHRLSSATSMRVNQMITKRKKRIFYQFLPSNSLWKCIEICLWIFGLKGLRSMWSLIINPDPHCPKGMHP